MHYIGVGCHITTLDFMGKEMGRLVKASPIATSIDGFMEFLKMVSAYFALSFSSQLPGKPKRGKRSLPFL